MWKSRHALYATFRRLRQKLTLREIAAVVAALAILIGLIVPKIMTGPDETRRVAARQDISTIIKALELYRRDHGSYPTQEPGLRALIEQPNISTLPGMRKDNYYLKRLPNDPWGNAYQYRNPGVHGEIDVFSYGADGKQGGEGSDADIGSWK
jgi:general secretion pathway protein G